MRWRILGVVAALASACSSVTTESIVQKRMSTDYSCPAASVSVTELPAYEYRAQGCGHTSTFICIPQPPGEPVCTKQASEPLPFVDAGPSPVVDAGTK